MYRPRRQHFKKMQAQKEILSTRCRFDTGEMELAGKEWRRDLPVVAIAQARPGEPRISRLCVNLREPPTE
jgi:hypothetical protein